MKQKTFNILVTIITIITVGFFIVGTCTTLPELVSQIGVAVSIALWGIVMVLDFNQPKS